MSQVGEEMTCLEGCHAGVLGENHAAQANSAWVCMQGHTGRQRQVIGVGLVGPSAKEKGLLGPLTWVQNV